LKEEYSVYSDEETDLESFFTKLDPEDCNLNDEDFLDEFVYFKQVVNGENNKL